MSPDTTCDIVQALWASGDVNQHRIFADCQMRREMHVKMLNHMLSAWLHRRLYH